MIVFGLLVVVLVTSGLGVDWTESGRSRGSREGDGDGNAVVGVRGGVVAAFQSPSTMNRPLRRRRRLLSSSSSSSSEPPPPPPQHPEEEDENPGQDIVIAGAGIMGISTAYYLVQLAVAGEEASTRRKIRSITLVDPTGTIGACASGKAGGLLAQDWRDGTPLEALQRSGFALHQQLAEEDDVALETTPTPTTNTNTPTTTTAGTPKRISKNPTDYRRLTCVSIAVDETINGTPTSLSPQRLPQKPPSKKLTDVEWVTPAVVLVDNDDDDVGEDVSAGESGGVVILGDETTIAQVHPRKFCERLWERIRSSTSNTTTSTPITTTLRQGRIVKAQTIPIATAGGGATAPLFKMTGVDLADGTHLPADVLLVACGPWTYEANTWFDDYGQVIPDITSVKCHSILVPKSASSDATGTLQENTNTNSSPAVNTTSPSYSQAVFFDSNGAIGEEGDLEVYPRLDGDLYVNGFANAEGRCRESPNEERIEDEKIQQLRAAMELVYGRPNEEMNDEENEAMDDNDDDDRPTPPSPRAVEHTQQVCYWPETPDGLPIIGKIPAIEGVYVAAGHSVWGIVQGPATGKAVAELILYGKARCIDLTPFQVERYYRNSS